MKEQLKRVEERYLQLETLLSMPETQAAPDIYCSYLKEYNGLTETVSLFREYTDCQKKQEEAYSLWSDGTTDKELRLLAWEEYEKYKSASEKLWEQLSVMLLPKDPLDGKDILIEIRGCAGGEEAALFAADLFRMYSMFAVSEGLSVELLNENPTELGGYKEVVFQVSGKTAYSLFKFESGVHRVQRVRKTES
ncbi:MAG: PCRF domain-containing protein, partial [Clostridia bacterium]|nr:PCRF domain-containing protein [Clostridia bacterium]